MFKSIFGLKKTFKDFKKEFIKQNINEDWFIEHFTISGKFPLDEDSLGENLDEMGREVILALITDFLVKKDYIQKLKLRYKQLKYNNFYGDPVYDEWFKEVRKFTKLKHEDINLYIHLKTPNILKNELKDKKLLGLYYSYTSENSNLLSNFINQQVIRYIGFYDQNEVEEFSIVDNPYEYEKIVAEKFSMLGWESFNTPGSGDQGADILIEKDGLKFVVQCKLYSQPVGNKAVQEVTSAKDFYEAVGALVVTNSDYTKSARQLAESQSVWLLHDSQLEDWNMIIDRIREDIKS